MSAPHENEHGGHDKNKEVIVVVNARKKTVTAKELSFEQIVALAFDPVPPNSLFTVTYRRGQSNQEGTLQPGQTVHIHEGMIFNVTETGQS